MKANIDGMGKATLSHLSFGTSILEEPSLKFEFNKMPSWLDQNFWYTQLDCAPGVTIHLPGKHVM